MDANKPYLTIPSRKLVICLVLMFAGSLVMAPNTLAKPAKPSLSGHWILDVDESKRIQPKQKTGGFLSGITSGTTVSVGGIPLPRSSSTAKQDSTGSPKDPDVVFCKAMTITPGQDLIRIDYSELGAKSFHKGKVRGRSTNFSRSRLSTSYESTSRKVSQKYVLESADKLVVTVTFKPKSGTRRVVKKVFNRQQLEKS